MHTPLRIENTPNCQPQPWHPSVIFMEEGWSGHRWWMAQTPFPPKDILPYRDRYELPCIHYSNNGKHWYPIPKNPIDDISEDMVNAHNFLSDPHLVLRNGVMECYYRLTLLKNKQPVGNQTLLLRKKSTEGHHWSDREVIADLRTPEDIAIWGEQIISPAILWDGCQYRCWYVDRSGYLDHRRILMTTSTDGVTWNKYTICTLPSSPTFDPWHIDVQYYDGLYQLIVYDKWNLRWFDSLDGVDFQYVSDILSPSNYFMNFYSEGLYRACSLKVGKEILVFFSAKNAQRTSIGLLKTTDRKHFMPVNGMFQCEYLSKYIIPQISWKNTKRFVKHTLHKINIL